MPAPTEDEVAAFVAGRLAAEVAGLTHALSHPPPAGADRIDDVVAVMLAQLLVRATTPSP